MGVGVFENQPHGGGVDVPFGIVGVVGLVAQVCEEAYE